MKKQCPGCESAKKDTLLFVVWWCFTPIFPWEALGHHQRFRDNRELRDGSNPQLMGGGWIRRWAADLKPSTVQLVWVLGAIYGGQVQVLKDKWWCCVRENSPQRWGRHSCEQPDCGETEVVLQEPQLAALCSFFSGIAPLGGLQMPHIWPGLWTSALMPPSIAQPQLL